MYIFKTKVFKNPQTHSVDRFTCLQSSLTIIQPYFSHSTGQKTINEWAMTKQGEIEYPTYLYLPRFFRVSLSLSLFRLGRTSLQCPRIDLLLLRRRDGTGSGDCHHRSAPVQNVKEWILEVHAIAHDTTVQHPGWLSCLLFHQTDDRVVLDLLRGYGLWRTPFFFFHVPSPRTTIGTLKIVPPLILVEVRLDRFPTDSGACKTHVMLRSWRRSEDWSISKQSEHNIRNLNLT